MSASRCASTTWPTPRARSSTTAQAPNCKILLPVDVVVARGVQAPTRRAAHRRGVNAVAADEMILDVGPRPSRRSPTRLQELQDAGLERPARRLRDAAVRRRHGGAGADRRPLTGANRLLSVAGGGDTVAALAPAGVEEQFTYVSTAGGAFLEWLEGKTLPGVAALNRAA